MPILFDARNVSFLFLAILKHTAILQPATVPLINSLTVSKGTLLELKFNYIISLHHINKY